MSEITALSSGKFVASESGLVVNGKPTYKEWLDYGKLLHRVNRALQMVIGDWLNEGEKRYGETYAQATALWPDMQQDTLKNWKWVAGSVPKSLRRDVLHYSHYVVVAALPDKDKREWLSLAERDMLTSHDLKERIRETNGYQRATLSLAELLDDAMARLVKLAEQAQDGQRQHIEAAIEELRLAREKEAVSA